MVIIRDNGGYDPYTDFCLSSLQPEQKSKQVKFHSFLRRKEHVSPSGDTQVFAGTKFKRKLPVQALT